MRILIAEDDRTTRRMLEVRLTAFGHQVDCAEDGMQAWEMFQAGSYDVVVSDWMMPKLDGPDLCRRIRALEDRPFCFLLMLTSRGTTEDLVEGIESGADDFMTKPFVNEELQARLHAAGRVIELERRLAGKVEDLERALSEVKTLRGLLPICMYCHKVRDDSDIWEQIEAYIASRSEAEFTHSICPPCYEDQVKPMLSELRGDGIAPAT